MVWTTYLCRLALALALASVGLSLPQQSSQWPMLADDGHDMTRLSGQGHPPRLTQQNDTICDAGSSQWTGSVPLGQGRDMFFWYFESRSKPEDAPVIIWLNGGPGASSLLGAFHEIGPCSVSSDGTSTLRNPKSWTNFANMLFVDQPIGVGYSYTKDAGLWADNLVEGGVDLENFLDTFFQDLFPPLAHNKLHLAGESFGGKYVPVYAAMMRRKLDSIVLVDAFIDASFASVGYYDHFCGRGLNKSLTEVHGRPPRHFNVSVCEEMEEPARRCERAGVVCRVTYDAAECARASEECAAVMDFFFREVVPGGRDPYDDRLTCAEPPLCGNLGMEQVTTYLNTPRVLEALGLPKGFNYSTVNMELNEKWSNQSDATVPSLREIARLLDEKHTPVLVINGNNDVIINTEGVIRALEAVSWSHQAGFRTQALQPFFYHDSKGSRVQAGSFKTKGKLTLVAVDEAGHMSPHDQPDAVAAVMEAWLAEYHL